MIRARINDKETVVNILCHSFKENQSVLNAIKDDREETIRGLMAYAFFACMKDGDVFLDDKKQACILTIKQKTNTLAGLWEEIKLVINCIGLKKLPAILKREKLLKANRSAGEHIYLWFIGTMPANQGKGIGSSLLQDYQSHVNDQSIVLETSLPRNLPFYRRLGFSLYKELNVGYNLYMLKTG